jgi:hypothetical protein
MNIFSVFSKRQAEPELVPDPAAIHVEQSRYAANLTELHATDLALLDAEQAIARHNAIHKDTRITTVNGEIFKRVGAMVADPELQQLESRRHRCMEKRNALLAEHARLKMVLGLTR